MLLPQTAPERTLGYAVTDWIEANCAVPDGDHRGEPLQLTDEQFRFVAWFYALDADGAFIFRRGMLMRPQKWGKGPLSAAIICAEAAGPTVFDGWDATGEPKGRPRSTPWIQVVAVSEDQTDNVWTALVPMIELGALAAEIADTGKTRINLPDGGVIEPVTSAAISRLGQRLTFANHDETHSWLKANGGEKLADTQRRNLAGMGGRSLETTNAFDPSENSVAQQTYEANLDDVLIDYPVPAKGSFKNARDRARIIKRAYGDSWWINLDRIEAECQELLPRDPNQAARFFGNLIVAGQDRAFDLEQFKSAARPDERIEPGRLITLGFDGARRHDATGLVATDVETGFQQVLGVWAKPEDVSGEDWEIDGRMVDEAVADAFERFDVFRMYCDPPWWQTEIDEWAGRYGEKKVVAWWTNRRKAMAYAVRAWTDDLAAGNLTHDGDPIFTEHVGNAVRRATRMRDDDTGAFLWYPTKDGANSPRKIDLSICAILSWAARGDALKTGATHQATSEIVSW